MSKFLNQALIRKTTHLITSSEYNNFVKAYEKKDEETKKVYNENAELYFNARQSTNNDISLIRDRVNFFYWVTIISFVLTITSGIILISQQLPPRIINRILR